MQRGGGGPPPLNYAGPRRCELSNNAYNVASENCSIVGYVVYYNKYSNREIHMPKSSGSYSTSDLSRKSGDIIAEALRHPVTITQRNKPRLVLLNIEDYQRLMKQSDRRTVGTIETM